MFGALIESLGNFNRVISVVILYAIYRLWRTMQPSIPFPDENQGPKLISSLSEFQEILRDNANSIVVVDFYATWCPPCRIAAPIFHKMSEEQQLN